MSEIIDQLETLSRSLGSTAGVTAARAAEEIKRLRAELERKDALLLTMTKQGEADDAEIDRLRAELSEVRCVVTGCGKYDGRTMRKLRADLERERMRLAACGAVAASDTPESAAKAREMHPDYRSASLDAVERCVDECMRLRAELRYGCGGNKG